MTVARGSRGFSGSFLSSQGTVTTQGASCRVQAPPYTPPAYLLKSPQSQEGASDISILHRELTWVQTCVHSQAGSPTSPGGGRGGEGTLSSLRGVKWDCREVWLSNSLCVCLKGTSRIGLVTQPFCKSRAPPLQLCLGCLVGRQVSVVETHPLALVCPPQLLGPL